MNWSVLHAKVCKSILVQIMAWCHQATCATVDQDICCYVVSTLLNIIEHFKCALDRGEYIDCISMDISKAFDCLPHCLTICKLHAYGLYRDACTLIASYLYQCKHRVKIGNVKSEWQGISKGVHQGSILGLLIFNIFMNDLSYFVKRWNLFNYADDNSVSVNSKELNIVSQLLQSEAEVTVRWFCSNAMDANPSKFQGILSKGNKQASDFEVCVGGQNIEFSKSMTSLGICIDENSNFDLHIKDMPKGQTPNQCLTVHYARASWDRYLG